MDKPIGLFLTQNRKWRALQRMDRWVTGYLRLQGVIPFVSSSRQATNERFSVNDLNALCI